MLKFIWCIDSVNLWFDTPATWKIPKCNWTAPYSFPWSYYRNYNTRCRSMMIRNKLWYHLNSFILPDLIDLWSFLTGGWDSCLEAFWLARRQGRCTSWSFIRVSRPQETATRSNCIRRQTRGAMWCGLEKDIEVPGEVSGSKPFFGVLSSLRFVWDMHYSLYY